MVHRRMRLPSTTENMRNVTFQQHKVSREERGAILGVYEGYRGCTIWFTGLSGAGKTTISFALEKTLTQLGIPCYGLDGDNVRHGLCKNLGFGDDDRVENVRRVAEMAKLFADMGVVTLASFISPFAADRAEARRIHEKDGIRFFEIYVNTPLFVCEARDPKNLYKKARLGQLRGFTGIDSVYEQPLRPDLTLTTKDAGEADCVQIVLKFLCNKGVLPEKVIHLLYNSPIRELYISNEEQKPGLIEAAAQMPRIELSDVDVQWLQVLAEGWATPLSGFMRERQYLQALHNGQIFDLEKSYDKQNGCVVNFESKKHLRKQSFNSEEYDLLAPINQSIPIVLPINELQKASLYRESGELQSQVALFHNDLLLAVLNDVEVYAHRKEERVHRQFGYADERHPTIKLIGESGDWLLGGDLKVFEQIKYNDGLDEYRKTPAELRKHFAQAGCDCVFAFQLRNPIHNGHALLMRETRAQLLHQGYCNPMLLLHPLGGWTKDDDVPLPVRIAQHKAVISAGILDAAWTVLAIFPSPMLYAGPTEVQWHARARMACGVNAYIVGRDPAGIQNPETGDYLYEPTHGAKVLSMAPGLLNLEIIPFRVAAYDKKKQQMDFFDPSRKDDFLFISGSAMRSYARNNQQPPDGFMAPTAWQILSSYYENLTKERN